MNRQRMLAKPGHYQGGCFGLARPDLGQERETVHARHLDVGDDRVVVPRDDPVERLCSRLGCLHGHPGHSEPQGLGKRLQQRRVVVNNKDEDARRRHGGEVSFVSAGARGRWMTNVAPSPGWLMTDIVWPRLLEIKKVMY